MDSTLVAELDQSTLVDRDVVGKQNFPLDVEHCPGSDVDVAENKYWNPDFLQVQPFVERRDLRGTDVAAVSVNEITRHVLDRCHLVRMKCRERWNDDAAAPDDAWTDSRMHDHRTN